MVLARTTTSHYSHTTYIHWKWNDTTHTSAYAYIRTAIFAHSNVWFSAMCLPMLCMLVRWEWTQWFSDYTQHKYFLRTLYHIHRCDVILLSVVRSRVSNRTFIHWTVWRRTDRTQKRFKATRQRLTTTYKSLNQTFKWKTTNQIKKQHTFFSSSLYTYWFIHQSTTTTKDEREASKTEERQRKKNTHQITHNNRDRETKN